jgi:hypothetical protein
MKLAFRNKFFKGFTKKEVDILLNLGTLESLCKDLEIDFWQMDEYAKKDNYDFMVNLLYCGYIADCKEHYKKPKYTLTQAFIWFENMSYEAKNELNEKMVELSGEIQKMSSRSKKKVR